MKCGEALEFDALVRGGSYVLRCRHCGGEIHTSWMAIGPKWKHPVVVFEFGNESVDPLIEGIGSEIWKEIEKLASNGKTLVLRSPTSPAPTTHKYSPADQ